MIPALVALAARALPLLAEGAGAATAARGAATVASASRTSSFVSGAVRSAAGNYVGDKLTSSGDSGDSGGSEEKKEEKGNPFATRLQPV